MKSCNDCGVSAPEDTPFMIERHGGHVVSNDGAVVVGRSGWMSFSAP